VAHLMSNRAPADCVAHHARGARSHRSEEAGPCISPAWLYEGHKVEGGARRREPPLHAPLIGWLCLEAASNGH
jgi:hypothetical protein